MAKKIKKQIICAYCGDPIKKGDLKKAIIIARNWSATNFRSPLRNYHKSLNCHNKDQWSHEG